MDPVGWVRRGRHFTGCVWIEQVAGKGVAAKDFNPAAGRGFRVPVQAVNVSNSC